MVSNILMMPNNKKISFHISHNTLGLPKKRFLKENFHISFVYCNLFSVEDINGHNGFQTGLSKIGEIVTHAITRRCIRQWKIQLFV